MTYALIIAAVGYLLIGAGHAVVALMALPYDSRSQGEKWFQAMVMFVGWPFVWLAYFVSKKG